VPYNQATTIEIPPAIQAECNAMRLLPLLLAVVCLTPFGAGFVRATDPNKIDHPLAKEPAYQSKMPKYALLVFGPKAATRTWLVLDGATLYVDRNGNGDLTEAGEKVVGKKGNSIFADDVSTFAIGELRDGDRRHLNATLTASGTKAMPGRGAGGTEFSLRMDVEVPGYRGTGEGGRVLQMAGPSDFNGDLQFADQPRGAPILHFGGPWTIALYERPTFRVGREMEMYLALGTPGRGKGTFVSTAYEGVIPRGVYPRAEIAFPAAKPGEAAVKVLYELNGRC
jgi:hypothetical protein